MCGIAGIVDRGAGFGRARLAEIVTAMRDTMVHRGPDDAGVWVDPDARCALAHRRLSVIDLSSGARQPLGNEDGSVQVTFNGEIYNYATLRRRLESEGHQFRSQSDTEVLPHLFEQVGNAPVGELDGMFAFGVWRTSSGSLLLARDPFGKKPLYYAEGRGCFGFASELQALMQIPGFDSSIDRDALALYLLLQYVPAPWSIFRGARKLPPGATLELDSTGAEPRIEKYYGFKTSEPALGCLRNVENACDELRARVTAAVEKRLISDVPLGAFLSGGVDSSLVVAIMTRELGRDVQTFSIGYRGTEETEHHFAAEVASHLGTQHHEHLLMPDALELVEHLAQVLDEPNGDSSCLPTFLLAKYTRAHVTVALSGDGGDELFGGYRRYTDTIVEMGGWLNGLAGVLPNSVRPMPADRYLSPRWLIFQPPEVAALLGGMPSAVDSVLSGWRERLNDRKLPLIHRLREIDAEFYMPGAVLAKVDRMSMQSALEVRCPLLDRDVAAFAHSLPARMCWRAPDVTKFLLKRLAERYLPAAVVHRKKMGFGLPTQSWSRERMLDMANEALLGPSSVLGGLLEDNELRRLMGRQSAPGGFSIYQVWPLLILELWLRAHGSSAQSSRSAA